jgi:hypothetical protein
MDYYRSLNHKIHTALTFSRGDWGILLKAWIWLLYIDLLLRTQPFPRVQQIVSHQHKVQGEMPPDRAWDIIRSNQRFVMLAARLHLYRMQCLRQALTLRALLGEHGIPTELRLGVRREAERFLAHAWLEYEGQSIELSNGYEYFKPLISLENL